MTELADHYLEEVRRLLREQKRMAEAAIGQLDDAFFFKTIDPESNSIAVIVNHIAGNARSRFTDFLTTDGEKPDRFRDREFEISAQSSRADVLMGWEQGWTTIFLAADHLKADDLSRTITIRKEPHTVMQALNRAVAHYALHIGQIVFLAKHLRSSSWKTLSIPRGKSEEFKYTNLKDIGRGGPPEK